MDRIEKGNGRSASFSDIFDVRVVGIAMIIRDQFTCLSSIIDQLVTVRGGIVKFFRGFWYENFNEFA